jgi:hypothetical protein
LLAADFLGRFLKMLAAGVVKGAHALKTAFIGDLGNGKRAFSNVRA